MTDEQALHNALAAALLAFQKNPPTITLDKENPHYKNKYASLDGNLPGILDKLNEVGIVVIQSPTTLDNGQVGLRTRLIHPESGGVYMDTMPLVLDRQNMQGLGSALTYAKRYAIFSMLGLVGDEDEDGNIAATPASVDGWTTIKARIRDAGHDDADESERIFNLYVRAASKRLYGETESAKLSDDQKADLMSKASAASWKIAEVPPDNGKISSAQMANAWTFALRMKPEEKLEVEAA